MIGAMSDIPDDALRETWDSIYDKSVELATMIKTACRESEMYFDAMVVVPRGAYYPANIVSRELGFGATDLLHASIASYNDGSTEQQQFRTGQMPTADQVRGKDLLIIEEVCDTGYTLKYLTDYLQEQGAKLIMIGALHYKPEQNRTGIKPDWYVTATDKWIVYPWEAHEANGRQ
jgi:hypoxanthine phosphoribosyltransferase